MKRWAWRCRRCGALPTVLEDAHGRPCCGRCGRRWKMRKSSPAAPAACPGAVPRNSCLRRSADRVTGCWKTAEAGALLSRSMQANRVSSAQGTRCLRLNCPQQTGGCGTSGNKLASGRLEPCGTICRAYGRTLSVATVNFQQNPTRFVYRIHRASRPLVPVGDCGSPAVGKCFGQGKKKLPAATGMVRPETRTDWIPAADRDACAVMRLGR